MDFKGFKWLIQTTDYHPVGAVIGIILNPDDIHIMKKSAVLRHVRRLQLLFRGVTMDDDSRSEPRKRRRTRMRISPLRHRPMWCGWLFFIVVPLVIVVVYAFTDNDGRLHAGKLRAIWAVFLHVFWRSIWLGAMATVICLLLGYPAGLSSSPGRAHGYAKLRP